MITLIKIADGVEHLYDCDDYSSFFPAFSPTAVVELSAGVGACAVGIILKILAKYVS